MAQKVSDVSPKETYSTRLTPANIQLCQDIIKEGKATTVGEAIRYILDRELFRRESIDDFYSFTGITIEEFLSYIKEIKTKLKD